MKTYLKHPLFVFLICCFFANNASCQTSLPDPGNDPLEVTDTSAVNNTSDFVILTNNWQNTDRLKKGMYSIHQTLPGINVFYYCPGALMISSKGIVVEA